MATQRASSEFSPTEYVILWASLLPNVVTIFEHNARRSLGWSHEYVTSEMSTTAMLLGAALMMAMRVLSAWRNSAVDLRLHGPMAILGVSSLILGGLYAYAVATSSTVNDNALFFFAGILVACLALMLMAPSKLRE